MRQKLMTKQTEKAIPSLYEQDGKGGDAIAYAKYFCPNSRLTIYLTEYDPQTNEGFGFIESPFGKECDELGYVSFDELEQINDKIFNNPFPKMSDVWIERDQYFKPTRLNEINPVRFAA